MTTTVTLNGAFRLEAPAPPTVVSLVGAFRLRGPAPPTLKKLSGGFMLRDLESTILYFNDGAWHGSPQRAWDGSAWFPPVL